MFKAGDIAIITKNDRACQDYCNKYCGTDVKILHYINGSSFVQVEGYDGYVFDMPTKWLIDYDEYYGGFHLPELPEEEKQCTCGAWKTWGEDCSITYHSDWCEFLEEF